MHVLKPIAFAVGLLIATHSACAAATITVHYSGTYTGSWSGNLDPLGGPVPNASYGEYFTTPFDLTFTFNSQLAIPGGYAFNDHHLGNPVCCSPSFDAYPSVGSAVFTSPLFNLSAGTSYAVMQQISGSTSQNARSVGYGANNLIIGMSVFSQFIPSTIFEPYSLDAGFTGFGGIDYTVDSSLGSFSVNLGLTPLAFDVSISGVPEPSTWAMMILGFSGLGFLTYFQRDRKVSKIAEAAVTAGGIQRAVRSAG